MKNYEKLKYFHSNSPAESVPDQGCQNVQEQFTQRVTAETSLVFVYYAGKQKKVL